MNLSLLFGAERRLSGPGGLDVCVVTWERADEESLDALARRQAELLAGGERGDNSHRMFGVGLLLEAAREGRREVKTNLAVGQALADELRERRLCAVDFTWRV